MKILVHLSDIHFGRVDPSTLQPLQQAVESAKPDLVAISGDLTQRARTSEFQQARLFLDSLPKPQIVVPGNHDIPLHNLYARFVSRLDKYKLYITEDLEPQYADAEILVVGINTARSGTWKGGRINRSQLSRVHHRLCAANPNMVRVVVTHHPFELPEGFGSRSLVGRAHAAMNRLASCGADLFLAGHLHLGYTAQTASRYEIEGHSAVVIQAGTATSTRGRGQTNSFNIIRIDAPQVSVEQMVWNSQGKQFTIGAVQHFHRAGQIWVTKPGETENNIAAPPSV